jgi:hypothetical protein
MNCPSPHGSKHLPSLFGVREVFWQVKQSVSAVPLHVAQELSQGTHLFSVSETKPELHLVKHSEP